MRFLTRGWLPIIIGIAIGLAAGLALQNAQKPSYSSAATVLVTDTGVETSSTATGARTNGLVNLDTEANLVTSTPVVSAARTTLKSTATLAFIASHISVTVPSNSDLMKIAYKAPTAKQAQAGASAVAAAYLKNRSTVAHGLLDAQIKVVDTNITSTTTKLNAAIADVAKYKSDSVQGGTALSNRDLLSRKLDSLNNQLIADQSIVITPGSVTGAPVLPTKASGFPKALYLASGLGLGLLLGLLGAYLLARRPVTRLRRPTDVQQAIDVPVIARIDDLRYGKLAEVNSPAAETYRRLVNVIGASLASRGGIVVIAGTDDTLIASTITHNIAATMSRSGEHVSVLRTAVDEESSSIDGSEYSYRILPSAGPRTRQAIDNLREIEDGFVLIDAPEPLKTADAQSYGAAADAVVIVLRDKTSAARAKRVLAEFDAVAAPVLGTVLVTISKGQPRVGALQVSGPKPATTQGSTADDESTRTHGRAVVSQVGRPAESSLSDAGRRVTRRNVRARSRADRG